MLISLIDCTTEECETCDPIETCTKCNSGRYLLTSGTTTTCPRKYPQISDQVFLTLSKGLKTHLHPHPHPQPYPPPYLHRHPYPQPLSHPQTYPHL